MWFARMVLWSLALTSLALIGCQEPARNLESDSGTDSGLPEVDAASADDAGSDAGTSDDSGVDAASPDSGRMPDGGLDAGPLPVLCDFAVAAPGPYPAPDAFPPPHGPGVSRQSFTNDQLGVVCAYLDGGPQDVSDHHNLLQMYDGYLLMPWAPEYGAGGITLFDISDACNPRVVGSGTSLTMRETHAIGFSSLGGRYAVVNHLRGLLTIGAGIEFWDLSDITAPARVSSLTLPGSFYPDAYARVVLSVFWQVPYVYVAGADNGVYVVDATDPRRPRHVATYAFDPVLRVGQVQAVGNLLVATETEGARTVLLDISDPIAPQPIPGGDFVSVAMEGGALQPRGAYLTNTSNGYVWYARKESGGGVIAMDIHDPSMPVYAGDIRSEGGNGGYVFIHERYAFVGESHWAAIYDISDLGNITEIRRLDLEGDLDTAVPIGHLAVLSVDDDAVTDHGSAIAPYLNEPDSNPPVVTWTYPASGATDLAPTSRFGVTFSEMVDVQSAWEGSVRLYRQDLGPTAGRVQGAVSAQEAIVTFAPYCELSPGTYVLEIPAGGVRDFAGNPITTPFVGTFTVGT